MTGKIFLKAFISGISFPSVAIPISYLCLYYFSGVKATTITTSPLSPIYMPLFFGVANVVYVRIHRSFPAKYNDALLIAIGLLLGVIVNFLHITTLLQSLLVNLPISTNLSLPIIYALIFRFIVKPLNKLLQL